MSGARRWVTYPPYLVLADFSAYAACHRRVEALWSDPAAWHQMAMRNIAGMGRFSSDRTIREYADEIWNCPPVPLPGALRED